MDLRVMLKLDGSGFTQGVSKVRQEVGHLGNNVFGDLKSSIAAAFTVGAVATFSKKVLDFSGNMRDLADRMGVNVEWLQKMNNAAGQAGSSAEDLAVFLAKVGQAREAAFRDPKGKEANSFGRLGISQSDVTNLPAQQFLERLIQAFSNGMTVQMENDLIDVGGKAAGKLINTFAQGIAEGGPVISEETINALDDAGDSFFILQQELITGFAPAIVKIIELVRHLARESSNAVAVVGAAAGQFQFRDVWDPAARIDWMWNPMKLAKKLWGGVEAAQKEIGTRDAAWAELDDKAKISRAAERARRRQRETSPPGFVPAEAAARADSNPAFKTGKVPGIVSDSLLAVGNFLGGNRGTIDSVAKETNALIKRSNALLERVVANTGRDGDSINVPG